MLRTVPAGRSALARVLMLVLIGASAILGLIGMHAFHPETHLVQHSTLPAAASISHASHDTGLTSHNDAVPGDLQPGTSQPGTSQPDTVGCGDCGMGGGHVMVMVLCLLTLLVSAAVTLWPPARRLIRPVLSRRLLYQQLAARWPTTLAPSRPPSLQMLSISRK